MRSTIRNILLSFLFLLPTIATAGLPPTSSKDSADSSNITTFNYKFPNFTGTHTGITFSLGVNSPAGGGTGTSTLFTPGSLVFAGASGVYSQNNADLFWDNVNNRLGINQAVPTQALHVVGNEIVTGFLSLPSHVGNGTTGVAWGNTASPPVFIDVNGSTGAVLYNAANTYYDVFQVNNVVKMQIATGTASNNVAILGTPTINPLVINNALVADTAAQLLVATNGVTNKGIVVQAASSQSANLQEWQANNGSIQGFINSTFGAQFNNFSTNGSYLATTTAIGNAPTDGLTFSANTAATSGATVQASKQLHLEGSAWDTGSVSSKQTDWLIASLPVSGNPATGSLLFRSQIAGGGYTNTFTINSGTGGVVLAGPVTAVHLIGGSSAPTIAAGAGSGSGPTVSITGTDIAGNISVLTGTSPTASAVIATVTFNKTYGSAPYCIFTPTTATAAGTLADVYKTSTTTTLLINSTSVALSAATQYNWDYVCSQ